MPSQIGVDHVVPPAEAWRSGASGWTTTSRRTAFADDVTGPQLIAVTAEVNSSWGLSLQSSEKTALQTVLNRCSYCHRRGGAHHERTDLDRQTPARTASARRRWG